MGLSGQEYWSELPFPSLEDVHGPGIKPGSPALTVKFFSTDPPGEPPWYHWVAIKESHKLSGLYVVSHCLEAEKLKIKVPDEGLVPGSQRVPSCCVPRCRRGGRALWGPFTRALTPFMRAPPS